MYEKSPLGLLIGLSAGWLLAGPGYPEAAHERDLGPPLAAAAELSPELSVTLPVQQPVAGLWPAAAFDGTQYLMVWEDVRAGRSTLYGARIAANGDTLDPHGFLILDAFQEPEASERYHPVVAFGGSDYLVIVAASDQIIGVRVSPSGEVLDPGGFVIATADEMSYVTRPAVVFDGEQYMVAWTQGDNQPSADRGVYWAGPRRTRAARPWI